MGVVAVAVQISFSVLSICIWNVKAAILDYSVPVWLYSIHTTPVGLLEPKNFGVAVGISLISCLRAEKAWGRFYPQVK